MVESSLHESFPEPPVSMAPRMAEAPVEAADLGYKSTFAANKGDPAITQDWSVLSDDVVKMLDSLNLKNRRMEEALA